MPYPNNVPIAVSGSRDEVLSREVELVEVAGPSFDTRERSSELSVLGIIRIGNNLDQGHHINRQVDRLAARSWIGYIRRIQSQPACVACAPFMLIRPSGPRTTPGTKGNGFRFFRSGWALFLPLVG